MIVLLVHQDTILILTVRAVMSLVQFVQAHSRMHALNAVQGIFYGLRRQHVRHLVQLDMLKTLQVTLVCSAMLLAHNAQVQVLNVLSAMLNTSNSQRLMIQLALALVQLDMLGTLQLEPVCNAIFLVQFARGQAILNVLPAT